MDTFNNKWAILFSPPINSWRKDKKCSHIETLLKKHSIDYDLVATESSERLRSSAKMFINTGYKTIIIVGGDTALNDLVNTLMSFENSITKDINFSVIPYGVMNDFAHFWGIKEGNEEQIILALKRQRIRKIDLGRIRYTNKNKEHCHRYFLNCVNIGFIASIMNLKRKANNIFISRTLSFLISFISVIFQRMEYKMKLKINDEFISGKIMTLCVGNSTGYGQTPNAVPYNGNLDVSIIYNSELMQLFEGIYLFLRGKFLNHKRVKVYRTKKVDVNNINKALVSVDGRLINTPVGDFTIFVEQERLNFILPD